MSRISCLRYLLLFFSPIYNAFVIAIRVYFFRFMLYVRSPERCYFLLKVSRFSAELTKLRYNAVLSFEVFFPFNRNNADIRTNKTDCSSIALGKVLIIPENVFEKKKNYHRANSPLLFYCICIDEFFFY